MTLKEFNNYLQSFNKLPGEYTQSEIYEIGKAFKEVVDGKRWGDLAVALGWERGTDHGETLRGFIKRNLRKEGLLNTATESLYKRVQELDTAEEIKEEMQSQLDTLYKEKTKNRDILNAYRRLLRDDARIEAMLQAVRDSQQELASLPTFTYVGDKNTTNTEAVLLLSDLHIGVNCDNFYNKYNSDVAAQRLNMLVNKTIKYCNQNHVKRLSILNLGDMIHGVIHVNARVEQEMDVISQVMTASELLSNTLNMLQLAAPEVIYRSVVDNHSRIIPSYSDHIEKENFARLIDWYLEERLQGTSIKFAHDNIDIGLGKFTLLNGKQMMFAHGHQDNYNTVMQSWVGATKEYIEYMCMGHFHAEKQKSFQGVKVYVNGSIVGTEQYALSKRLFSNPSQTLLIFDDSVVINHSIDLTTPISNEEK